MSTANPAPHTTPTYPLTDDHLTLLLAALPPLLARAPPDWHLARRKQITRAIAWLHPADALQAQLAGQIVVLRRLAENTMGWSRVHTNSPERAHRLARAAANLMRSGKRLENALRQQQKRALPPGGARTTEPPPTAPSRSDALRPEPARAPAPAPVTPPTPQPARTSRRTPAPKPTRPTTPATGPTA